MNVRVVYACMCNVSVKCVERVEGTWYLLHGEGVVGPC